MKKLLKNLVPGLIILVLPSTGVVAQDDPMLYQRWNIFDINKVRTQFNNTGLLCDGNQQNMPLARPPCFEFPNGSGINYGTSVGFVVGAPENQDPGAVGSFHREQDYAYICDATMDEGSAAYWDEEHFAPYPELVGAGRAPMSDDPDSWPATWPNTYPGTGIPLPIGSEGWPGFAPNGDRMADQESFTMTYAWGGTDIGTNKAWLKTQLLCRGLAWVGSLYEDFIVWMYVVRNNGSAPIRDLRVAIHADLSFTPEFFNPAAYDADRHYYDPRLQLAYGWDDNSYEELPDGRTIGGDEIAWGGVIVLEMPGPTKKVATYDAFHFWQYATTAKGNGARADWYFKWNVMNLDDPHDSDKDGIDDDFDENGVPDADEGGIGYYIGSGADGVQTLGSEPFTLQPGELDTVYFAVVFGDNKDDLLSNARRALKLYESGWKVVKAPPAPVVEAVPEDGKVTLYWDILAEQDPEFEGYKIYRSSDNGVTWGSTSFTDFGGAIHFIPLAQFDLENQIQGHYRTLPEYAWFDLGDDHWVPLRKPISGESLQYFNPGDSVNVFVDRDVVNGMRYLYYVAAYDSGNGIVGPLENTPATDPAGKNNTVMVVPRARLATSTGDLDKIKVVPNPYVVAAMWEIGKEHQVQFIHLPERATIRIYNTNGDLVRTLEHSHSSSLAPSIEVWDLTSYNDQMIAPGLYFYHIDAPVGTKVGQFVVVL